MSGDRSEDGVLDISDLRVSETCEDREEEESKTSRWREWERERWWFL